jgi:DNA 3'-phosphatase
MQMTGNGGTAVFQEHYESSTKMGMKDPVLQFRSYCVLIEAHILTTTFILNRYLVAIVSNQGGISLKSDPKTVKSDQKRLADFKGKVSAVLHQLDVPISVYAATSRDQYRKPRTGMWKELLADYDLGDANAVDLDNSFFVGDAGGREAVAGGVSKDHSCVDRY